MQIEKGGLISSWDTISEDIDTQRVHALPWNPRPDHGARQQSVCFSRYLIPCDIKRVQDATTIAYTLGWDKAFAYEPEPFILVKIG